MQLKNESRKTISGKTYSSLRKQLGICLSHQCLNTGLSLQQDTGKECLLQANIFPFSGQERIGHRSLPDDKEN